MMDFFYSKKRIRIILLAITVLLFCGNQFVISASLKQDDVKSKISEAVALFHNKEVSRAIEKLRQIGDPAIPAVIELLTTDSSGIGWKVSLLSRFFSSVKGVQADAALIKLLSHESSYLRGFAVAALKNRKLRMAVPHLIKLLNDKNVYLNIISNGGTQADILIRDEAIDALQSITGKSFTRNKNKEQQAQAWLDWWKMQKNWK